LATHGYYMAEACRPENAPEDFIGESPLLLSGLFLAGANLKGKDADSLRVDDGIVTAEEVVGLNLHETQLVVLSACETGLGEVKPGEGVFGLRRAFQMAGAQTVLSALWQVDDKSTAELMGGLFATNDPLPETLRRLQLEQIQRRRANNQPDHPFFWAAFIATGGWK